VTTPANWRPGDDVVVHASVPTEEARKIFPNLVEHKVSISQFSCQAAYVNVYLTSSTTLGLRLSLHNGHVGRIKITKFCIVVQISTRSVQSDYLEMEKPGFPSKMTSQKQ